MVNQLWQKHIIIDISTLFCSALCLSGHKYCFSRRTHADVHECPFNFSRSLKKALTYWEFISFLFLHLAISIPLSKHLSIALIIKSSAFLKVACWERSCGVNWALLSGLPTQLLPYIPQMLPLHCVTNGSAPSGVHISHHIRSKCLSGLLSYLHPVAPANLGPGWHSSHALHWDGLLTVPAGILALIAVLEVMLMESHLLNVFFSCCDATYLIKYLSPYRVYWMLWLVVRWGHFVWNASRTASFPRWYSCRNSAKGRSYAHESIVGPSV